ncbi:hypothetical protein, partial [Mycobacterium intermedium]
NSGNVNTGFFIGGNYSNGAFWRGDYQGLGGFEYRTTIPEIPWDYDVQGNIEIPITGTINAITQDMFTLSQFSIPLSLQITVCIIYIPFVGCVLSGTLPPFHIYTIEVGPYTIDPSVLNPETPLNMVIQNPLSFHGSGTVGPFELSFGWQGQPGFFNSTDTPSSGFFNSGAGGASGFFNDAADGAVSGIGNAFAQVSGMFNAGGPGLSGFQNFGTLESGWANLGNFISGFYNSTVLDILTQAFLSGFGNYGDHLSGILQDNVLVP